MFAGTLGEMAPPKVTMDDKLVLQIQSNKRYGAASTSEEFIRSERDFIELLTWGTNNETDLYLLMDTNFIPAFYDLSTGLAGEILQKVTNYRIRLAIFGPFPMITSERFRELINESNKASSVRFFEEKVKAQSWLLS